MKILILNGTYTNKYEDILQKIVATYEKAEHNIEVLKLEDLNIAFCTGCWSCWVKTPGRCVHNDDTQMILRKVMNSEIVIHVTENVLGFTTSLTKKVLDKFVPLIHPYIELVNGESHHVKRYDKYPKLGLIYLDKEQNIADFTTTKSIFERMALNFKTELCIAHHLNTEMEELENENICI